MTKLLRLLLVAGQFTPDALLKKKVQVVPKAVHGKWPNLLLSLNLFKKSR